MRRVFGILPEKNVGIVVLCRGFSRASWRKWCAKCDASQHLGTPPSATRHTIRHRALRCAPASRLCGGVRQSRVTVTPSRLALSPLLSLSFCRSALSRIQGCTASRRRRGELAHGGCASREEPGAYARDLRWAHRSGRPLAAAPRSAAGGSRSTVRRMPGHRLRLAIVITDSCRLRSRPAPAGRSAREQPQAATPDQTSSKISRLPP